MGAILINVGASLVLSIHNTDNNSDPCDQILAIASIGTCDVFPMSE